MERILPSENKIIIYIEGIGKIHIPENFGYIDQDIKEDFKIHISDLIVKCLEDNNFPDMSDTILGKAIKNMKNLKNMRYVIY